MPIIHHHYREGKWVAVTPEEFAAHQAALRASLSSVALAKEDAPPREPGFGLGDAVAAVAQPIARAIDAVAGTHIAECGGCKKRREFLNNLTR